MDSFADRVRERMREYDEDAETARSRVSQPRSDAAVIRDFFEELDARIAGASGTHTQESKSRMAQMRPTLVKRAHGDPRAFVRDLERQLTAIRKEDESP